MHGRDWENRIELRIKYKKKKRLKSTVFIGGWKMGLEPTTFGTTIRRSNRLSYIHHFAFALQR